MAQRGPACALPCAILAGGRGTRLRPLTDAVPKCLVDVAGRPFLDWQLRLLASHGVREVVLCVGHLGDQVRAYAGDGRRWGLTVRVVDEGPDLRGTAGALRHACDEGALGAEFFVLYGDSYLPAPMRAVEAAWRAASPPALMTVTRNDGRWDRSNVVYVAGRVVLYDKRPDARRRAEMRWIDYGLSVLRAAVVLDRVPSGARADLGDLMGALSREGGLAGLEVAGRFYEVGSRAGLRDLEALLSASAERPASAASPASQTPAAHSGGMAPAGQATAR
jgi:NDP-sugar pyrophosphorylase family protein